MHLLKPVLFQMPKQVVFSLILSLSLSFYITSFHHKALKGDCNLNFAFLFLIFKNDLFLTLHLSCKQTHTDEFYLTLQSKKKKKSFVAQSVFTTTNI